MQHGRWQPTPRSPRFNHRALWPWCDSVYCNTWITMGLAVSVRGSLWLLSLAASLTKCHVHITWGQHKGELPWHLCLCVCVGMCAVCRVCVRAKKTHIIPGYYALASTLVLANLLPTLQQDSQHVACCDRELKAFRLSSSRCHYYFNARTHLLGLFIPPPKLP